MIPSPTHGESIGQSNSGADFAELARRIPTLAHRDQPIEAIYTASWISLLEKHGKIHFLTLFGFGDGAALLSALEDAKAELMVSSDLPRRDHTVLAWPDAIAS
jgi:hypothetical protein